MLNKLILLLFLDGGGGARQSPMRAGGEGSSAAATRSCATVITAVRRANAPSKLTVGILGRLDAHVRLALVQPGLPLAALLLQSGLRPALGVDIGEVRRRVVVGLHALVILNLRRRRRQG